MRSLNSLKLILDAGLLLYGVAAICAHWHLGGADWPALASPGHVKAAEPERTRKPTAIQAVSATTRPMVSQAQAPVLR